MVLSKYIDPTYCPKCKGDFEQGFIVDHPIASPVFFGLGRRIMWIAGKPEESAMGAIKVRNKEKKSVKTFRCTKCGYLENYA